MTRRAGGSSADFHGFCHVFLETQLIPSVLNWFITWLHHLTNQELSEKSDDGIDPRVHYQGEIFEPIMTGGPGMMHKDSLLFRKIQTNLCSQQSSGSGCGKISRCLRPPVFSSVACDLTRPMNGTCAGRFPSHGVLLWRGSLQRLGVPWEDRRTSRGQEDGGEFCQLPSCPDDLIKPV